MIMTRFTENLSSRITSLGRAMASFPVSPRYAKMLSLGHQHNLLPYVVAIVSALSVQELFAESEKSPSEEEVSNVYFIISIILKC